MAAIGIAAGLGQTAGKLLTFLAGMARRVARIRVSAAATGDQRLRRRHSHVGPYVRCRLPHRVIDPLHRHRARPAAGRALRPASLSKRISRAVTHGRLLTSVPGSAAVTGSASGRPNSVITGTRRALNW
jgi:hypothetical protein